MNYLVSIIVPVYNVEKYIEKCISSIINQSYNHLEIILINDGSTDSSGFICDKFAKNDPRIKVYHISNGGSSIARNYGLKKCQGEYIGFVDSDDWIKPNMFQELLGFAMSNNLKVVECASLNITKQNSTIKTNSINKIEGQEEALKRIIPNRRFAVWRRIYHKSVIKDRYFIPHILHQDVYFTLDIILSLNKFGYLNKPLYVYNVKNLDSVIRSDYNLKKLNSIGAPYYVVEKTKHLNSEIKTLASNYLIKFLTSHYNSLFLNEELDLDFNHRKKIKTSIKKHQNINNFSFYGYAIKLLPYGIYKTFLYLNKSRIKLQRKYFIPITNVKS